MYAHVFNASVSIPNKILLYLFLILILDIWNRSRYLYPILINILLFIGLIVRLILFYWLWDIGRYTTIWFIIFFLLNILYILLLF